MENSNTIQTTNLIPEPNVRSAGRIARVISGILALFYTGFLVRTADFLEIIYSLALIGALFTESYILHLLVSKYLPTFNKWVGSFFANIPIAIIWIMGSQGFFLEPYGALAGSFYFGISVILAGLTKQSGCEVLTIPGMITGQKTHLACIAFSPLDWVEEKLAVE